MQLVITHMKGLPSNCATGRLVSYDNECRTFLQLLIALKILMAADSRRNDALDLFFKCHFIELRVRIFRGGAEDLLGKGFVLENRIITGLDISTNRFRDYRSESSKHQGD